MIRYAWVGNVYISSLDCASHLKYLVNILHFIFIKSWKLFLWAQYIEILELIFWTHLLLIFVLVRLRWFFNIARYYRCLINFKLGCLLMIPHLLNEVALELFWARGHLHDLRWHILHRWPFNGYISLTFHYMSILLINQCVEFSMWNFYRIIVVVLGYSDKVSLRFLFYWSILEAGELAEVALAYGWQDGVDWLFFKIKLRLLQICNDCLSLIHARCNWDRVQVIKGV